MTLILDLVQMLLQDEAETDPCPEINLLWALYDRALRDLDLTEAENLFYVREAISWFRSTKVVKPFTFGYVIEHCHPSSRLLRLTAEKACMAEQLLYHRIHA